MDMPTYPTITRVYSWDLYKERLGEQWGFSGNLTNRQGILILLLFAL